MASHVREGRHVSSEGVRRTHVSRPQGGRQSSRREARGGGALRTFALMLFALVIGIVLGVFVVPLIPFPKLPAAPFSAQPAISVEGRTSVGEDELDAVLGTYRADGESSAVTLREAILESTTLDAMRTEEGTYLVPSVDNVLALARNRMLVREAEQRGLTVSDQDVVAYAVATLGTDDMVAIAGSYGMDVDQATELMRQSALIKKLHDEVVTTPEPAEPAAPTAPEEGAQDVMLPEYGQYVTSLLGDEWDVAANMWTRDDGPFRAGLKDYTITNDGATYSAAQAAYSIAYAQYAAAHQQASAEWTAFVNNILSHVTVELNSLVA